MFQSASSSSSPRCVGLCQPSLDTDTSNNHSKRPRRATSTSTSTNGDLLQAAELHDLSPAQRTRLYEEIHGVADPLLEDDQLLQSMITTEWETKVNYVRHKHMYDRAAFLHPRYVQNTNLRLLFLRAEDYHVGKAVRRMVQHFQIKADLFGTQALVRPIRLDDLNAMDMHVLKQGVMQFFPRTLVDLAGRPIYYGALGSGFVTSENIESVKRVLWFLFMADAEYCSIHQKHQVVMIMDARQWGTVAVQQQPSMRFVAPRLIAVGRGLPVVPVAVHLGYSHASLRPFLSTVQLLMGRRFRLGVRTHCVSSTMEFSYALLPYGIPPAMQPFVMDTVDVAVDDNPSSCSLVDMCKFQRHLTHFQQTQETATTTATHDVVIIPTKDDVLIGRGKPFYAHAGSKALYQRVQASAHAYRKATYDQQVALCQTMVDALPGRVLRRRPTCNDNSDNANATRYEWVQVDNQDELMEFVRKSFQRYIS